MGMFAIKLLSLSVTVVLIAGLDGRMVDLSWHYDENFQSNIPFATPFKLIVLNEGPSDDLDWYYKNDLSQGEHTGTHIDAPIHFSRNGRYVGDLPLSDLHGPMVVIDITDKYKVNKEAMMEVSDLEAWEAINGPIPSRAWIFQLSGASESWGNKEAYIGNVSDSTTWKFPGFSEEATDWLLDNRPDFLGVALDSVSLDNSFNLFNKENIKPTHIKLAAAGKIGIENVNNELKKVPASGAHVYVLPMKLKHGSGAPSRVVAVFGDDTKGWGWSSSATTSSYFLYLTLIIPMMMAL